MVCKRDWSVVRGGGSPMTRTGPADVVMSGCDRAAAGRPVLSRPGFRELVSGWPACGEPTVVRAVFPGSDSFKPVAFRSADRSLQPQPHYRQPLPGTGGSRPPSPLAPLPSLPSHRAVRVPGPPRRPCPRSPALAYRPYSYPPQWPGTALPGYSSDPGRDMLCICTSLPRWLQWP